MSDRRTTGQLGSTRGTRRRRPASRSRRRGRNQKNPLLFLIPLLLLLAVGAWLLFHGNDKKETPDGAEAAPVKTVNIVSSVSTPVEETGRIFQAENTDEAELAKRYYYSLLDENQQMIYREIVQGIQEHQETIVTKGGDPDLAVEVYGWVYMDYPEFFWITGASQATGYGEPQNYCEITPEYGILAEEAANRQVQVDAAAAEYLNGIQDSMGDYDKIKYIFETCIRKIDYVKDAPDNQNLYSGLVNCQTVCAGYSRTFQYLMNQLGIPVIYVTGTTDTGEAHGWNMVKCGENYYNVDVTWGDPIFAEGESGEYNLPADLIYYDFLCTSDAEFSNTHQSDVKAVLPACNATDLEYYRLNGRYMDTFDPEQILWKMEEDIAQTKESSEFKFATDELMGQAMEARQGLLDQASTYLCDYYSLESVKYSYSEDTATRKLMVFWQYS